MSQWLTLIGTGADGIDGLVPAARVLLDTAEIVLGSARLLKGTRLSAEVHPWASPISETIQQLESWRGRHVVILATGDPMHFGIGSTLMRSFGVEEMRILPSPSAFSLAAARMGWPMQDVETLSLHGRPVAALQAHIQPGAKLLLLTSDKTTVSQVAEMLIARGFGQSTMTVLENMGAYDQTISTFAAHEIANYSFGDFHTLAIRCLAHQNAVVLPRVPGLPDDAFVHDGQLTKREVRAATLSALGPTPGALLWDVGAGCGSVGIEWMRSARNASAIAFERHAGRLAMISENAMVLGTPGLQVLAGELPEVLKDQPAPSAIFLGGAVSNPAVFEACWEALPLVGTMVANAVTLEGEGAVTAYHKQHGGDLVRMEISRLEAVGSMRGLRPSMAVLQWRVVKS